MNDALNGIVRAVAGARVLATEQQVNAAYDRMAAEISARLAHSNPVIVCVMTGGLQPMAELCKRLTFAFEMDYLHATRYRGETSGGELVWKVSPSIPLEGRSVLVVDDILDEGHTLAHIQHDLMAQRPEALYTAVLVEKQHDRRDPEASADFVGLEMPDEYLVGCGMDYRNYFRQLPEIRAVDLTHE